MDFEFSRLTITTATRLWRLER